MKLGRLQDALADAEAAVAADPAFVKGFLRLAAAHEALAQVQGSAKAPQCTVSHSRSTGTGCFPQSHAWCRQGDHAVKAHREIFA